MNTKPYHNMPLHEGRDLPAVIFREIDLPQIRQWELNGEYYLVVKVRMVGKRTNDMLPSRSDRDKCEGEFRITSVKELEVNPEESANHSREEWEQDYARNLSGNK